MTRAGRSAGSGTLPERQWDVALSFAGAQRDYVGQVAEALKARGVRCFYDADEQTELWGRFLADELPAIYGEQAAAVVMFVSAEYAAREWTRLERRAALARAVRERREYVLPARFDDTLLPGLPSDMVTVDLRTRTPQQFAAMIADKLAALAASADAGSPARSARPARPAGAVRVSEADPRRLGVHAAISVPGVPEEIPPEYVPRDADAAEFGIRIRVAAAAERGGFVLLVGGSSVGKTRCAVEAVRTLLPDWWLVHPAGPAEISALAAAPAPRTVVWLDELQRYLDGEHGLTGAVVRAQLNAPHRVVIIGTIWTDQYAAYTTVPALGGADPHAREREVLDLAAVIRIDPEFSPAEQDRARAVAARDPRVAVALESAGYGLTQTLAAAPQLVARWEDALTAAPYAWAVLTAALDAARLGARAPLSADLLRAAAPGYLTSQQQAEAPKKWFKKARAYATSKLHGAAAALRPAGPDMGQITGYTAADYLIQYAGRERFYARVPASTWDAALSYIRDPADAARLADSARNRLLYRYAIPLYRHAADAGDEDAAWRLAEMLAQRGDLEELRARADTGDKVAAVRLAGLLAERGDPDEAAQTLRVAADAGDEIAAVRLAGLLFERGDLEELRARADAGDEHAATELAELLFGRGDLDKAAQILRAPADAGDKGAADLLAEVLATAAVLDDEGWDDGREEDAAAWQLAEDGDLDGLRALADAGNEIAATELAEMLAQRGDLEELRTRADTGDEHAAAELAEMLADRGNLEELRAQADAGNKGAAWRLARLLAQRGDLEEPRAQADTGDEHAAVRPAEPLAQRGDLEELRAQADTGDEDAAVRLAQRGDLEEAAQILRARADAGDWRAASRLVDLLRRQGRGEEAERLRRYGLNPDGSIADP